MKKILIFVLFLGISWQAFAFDPDQIQIHGFASQGYLLSNHYDYLSAETEKGTVEFNEFGLNVTSNLTDRFRLGMQFFARDLGDLGNDKFTIDWAFGDYRYRNWLGLRFGKMKKAIGLYNQSRDVDVARIGIFLPLSVYNENARTAQQSVKGFALYGTLPRGFDYQIQYGTLDSDFETEALDTPNAVSNEVSDNEYALHLLWNTPLDGLKLVGTLTRSEWSSVWEAEPSNWEFEFERKEWIVGVEYTIGELTCAVEYSQAAFEMVMKDFPGMEYTSEAYYGLVTYRLTDWFVVGTSYAVFYEDMDDKEGENYEPRGLPKAAGWFKDLAISTRFDVNEYWLIKLEGHWINGLNGASGYEGDNPSEEGFLVAIKMTCSF
ncbi:hypothetical protein U27_06540 [Candidatus Vecturithrix granuli]|uniref:Porin n=1 Tax=Vecturithrix granuli TaxID=1499967 RepID=A0A081C4Q0_VECG1|nr:hypothetical protein U27_06540 [Candidatus Vecturithrix granuli]